MKKISKGQIFTDGNTWFRVLKVGTKYAKVNQRAGNRGKYQKDEHTVTKAFLQNCNLVAA